MSSDIQVAIVGGGLCGIALAVALKRRGVPFTIYESRSSFTEIGAGINLGPSAVQSLRLIDAKLGEQVFKLSTRNPAPHEDVFMLCRYGAASGSHADADVLTELRAPPTGNMSLHRKDLLHALAAELDPADAQFNKKLARYEENDEAGSATMDGITLLFADGTSATASLLIGCDGIHSAVRTRLLASHPDPRVTRAHYFHEGVYRAVLPLAPLLAALGPSAHRSTLWFGPAGYAIMYPVRGGEAVNLGFWAARPRKQQQQQRQEQQPRDSTGANNDINADDDGEDGAWMLPQQGAQLRRDFRAWGPTAQRILDLFPQHETAFWRAHQHAHQPSSLRAPRVLLLGDAAHAMPPHLGAGAGQAVEDAYVLAEVLAAARDAGSLGERKSVEAALQAVEEVRTARSGQVHLHSCEAADRWRDFWGQHLEGAELEEWIAESRRRFEFVWNVDMIAEASKAKTRMADLFAQT